MAYYYVKNGGTATGDGGRYASQQTGSFSGLGAAGYYDSIDDAEAATTPPAAGDFINVSDLHVFNNSASTLTYVGVAPIPFYVVCVDDANVDQARTSGNRGEEQSGGSVDATFTNYFMSGITVLCGDDHVFIQNNRLIDCTLQSNGASDRLIFISKDGSVLEMIGGELESITTDTTVVPCVTQGGGIARLSGVTLVSPTSFNTFVNGGFGNGGGTVEVYGSDLSLVTNTLIANAGASAGIEDFINVRMDMCKIASGVAFTNETFKGLNHRALFTRCSDSSAAAEYQYHLHAFGGDVNDDSSIFRDESPAFTDSNQKISYEIITNSDASLGSPLWFDMPLNKWSPLSVGATDTLRFYLTTDTVLTDKDIYIELSYPDGTNKQTPNFISSAPTTVGGTLDLMAAGTTLTTDATSTWTGGLTNEYQIDVDTSGDAGADTYPVIKVYITKPSVTINLSMDFDLV